MDNRYLLTYSIGVISTFAWFDCEKEMENFISDNPKIEIIEKVEIIECREIEF